MDAAIIQNKKTAPIVNKDKTTVRVVKKCPVCGWRILDKVTPTTGIIEMKCPNCRKIVEVNLSYRKISKR
jgi:DNA-directed RNA polymerase subunit RPC12/RpoP